MVRLLSQFKFQTDQQKTLLEAFRELDNDADGFVSKETLTNYMQTMGEPLQDHELKYLFDLAIDKNSNNPDEIDIVRLSQLMIPSDDIIKDLTLQASEAIKEAEIAKKRAMSEQKHQNEKPKN